MGNFIKRYSNRILISIAILFIACGFLLPLVVKHYSKAKFDGLGTIGDWFGGIANPVIGVASFIIVYAAFRLQKDNNKSQQDQINAQNNTLGLQRFETTFFQLLTFHHEIKRNLRITTEPKIIKPHHKNTNDANKGLEELQNLDESFTSPSGKDFLSSSSEILKNYYSEEIGKVKEDQRNLNAKKTAMINSYVKFFEENEASLGHYFRNLYHIAKYINNSKLITLDEKKTYIGIYRAQLSAYELVLLLYNCSVKELGFPKFRKLVLDLAILKNMNKKLLLDLDHYTIFETLV